MNEASVIYTERLQLRLVCVTGFHEGMKARKILADIVKDNMEHIKEQLSRCTRNPLQPCCLVPSA